MLVFTRAEALAAGFSPEAIRHKLRSGQWIVVRRGVYTTAEAYAASPQLVDAAAACRADPEAVVCRQWAAALLGVPLLRPPPDRVTLLRGDGGSSHRNSVLLTAAALPAQDVTMVAGVPVTAAARTVVDVARNLPYADGVVTADAALHLGRVDPDDLQRVLAASAGWPGVRRAERVLAFADGRSESPLESVSRVIFDRGDVPAPELQVRIGGYRVDYLWRAQRVIGEADGAVKYDGSDPGALLAEKLRQEDLEDAGYSFVRWGWQHTRRPDALCERVLRRLRAAYWG